MAKQDKNPDQSLESKVFNSNQERIDKLKHAFNKLEAVMSSPISAPTPVNTDHIIKLNEELTAENSRLLTELDGITSDKDIAELNYDRVAYLNNELAKKITKQTEAKLEERNLRIDLDAELSVIKSKWWYKLMTWGW